MAHKQMFVLMYPYTAWPKGIWPSMF